MENTIIISVGGSLIFPGDKLDDKFLSHLKKFILRKISQNPKTRFFLVAGGGTIARHYRDTGKKVVGYGLTNDDLDWLGIHATRLNAHLLRTIFRRVAHPFILKHYEIRQDVVKPVAVAAGWKPGWSTDYCAVLLARQYGATTVVNLSNIAQVYDKDPKKCKDAKPISRISWKDYQQMVGVKWVPGMNAPFDPIAAREARKRRIQTIVLKGGDWKNLERYFKGKEFVGTVIS
ncbi:MAG: UMP kinase [Patescibacteria group bacterium]